MCSPMSHPDLCCLCVGWIEPGTRAVIDDEEYDMHQKCWDDDQKRVSDSNGASGL